jgi:hypothetical protein
MRKYDVAISVAEEDKHVAEAITAELKKLQVKYYFYEELKADSWGKYLIHMTVDTYGKHTRFVLLITSKTFVEKYWSRIETQVAISRLKRGNILQLRLDDTPVDGISRYVVYQDWKENPAEIAQMILKKVDESKESDKDKWVRAITFSIILTVTAGLGYWVTKIFERRCIVTESRVSTEFFDISNVEVTVAAYRGYCMRKHKVFPPQPSNSLECGPVRNVTWEEANEYCAAVGGRLPRELEWEYAALADQNTIYSGGTSVKELAVYHRVKPAKGGSRRANAWGIYDMTGNVAEWCDEWADSTKTLRIVKGGGYLNATANGLAVREKRAEEPTHRFRDVGFRVVWDKKE